MSCLFNYLFLFWFCFWFYVLQLLFCRESWGSKWYPCTGSRGTRPLPFPSGNMWKWSQGSKSKHCVSCKHQTEINALWSFQGICHSFAIKAIYFQHSQKSPKITKQRSMIINALCSFKVFAMMCFGMKATLGTFGENMPKPFEDILRALLRQFLSWET